MKLKSKKTAKQTLSDKIADALTVKPRADIEDDQVFGTKPRTLTKAEFSSSDSEDEVAISDFRKKNVNLLSEISKKYEGQVVSRKSFDGDLSDDYEKSDSDGEGNDLLTKGKPLDKLLINHESESESSEADEQPDHKKVMPKSLSNDDSESDISDDDVNQYQSSSKPKLIKKQKPASDSEHSSDAESGNESDNYDIMQFKKQLEESDEEDEGESGEDAEGSGEDGEGYDISQLEEPVKEDFEHMKKQNVSEEAKKGACVRNQLLLWEGLLEMRIHLQRCIATANQMPMPDTHNELKQNKEFSEECNATKMNISAVLDKFMTLQNILLSKYPETKLISTKKDDKDAKQDAKPESDEEIPSDTDNEEIPSDTEDEAENSPKKIEKKDNSKQTEASQTKKRKLEDYEKELSTSYKAFKPFRDSTIEKWNEKTRLAAATNIKNKNAPSNTVLQQISYILSDREKLVRRTQLKRSEYDIIGFKKEEDKSKQEEQEQNGTELKTKDRKDDDEYIPEIFDDSDFYHQLLRELIECKSADISDPVQLSRQWIALQQMRSKMKRKVDTKATKGRKIKYVVHNKLVNYMAPEKCTTWTDESTNELYSSLFGKMFEQNNVGLNSNLENGFKIRN